MRLLLTIFIFAGACLVWGQAGAQPAAPSVPGLTVTPPKPLADDPKLVRKLERFVHAYSAPGPVGQLARWDLAVCPAVSGLSAEQNDAVAARIRALAVEVGAPVADAAPCRRTVSVFFSDEPQHVLDVIRADAPVFLGYHYPAQTRRIATFTGAVGAWYTTATGGATGEATLDDVDHRFPGGNAGSRLTSGISSQFAGVVIVADVDRIRSHDLGAVADYVAMLALSKTSPRAGCQALPTILNLFADHCGAAQADRLTSVDLAYLKALYATNPGLNFDLQQAQLVADMTHSLRP